MFCVVQRSRVKEVVVVVVGQQERGGNGKVTLNTLDTGNMAIFCSSFIHRA